VLDCFIDLFCVVPMYAWVHQKGSVLEGLCARACVLEFCEAQKPSMVLILCTHEVSCNFSQHQRLAHDLSNTRSSITHMT